MRALELKRGEFSEKEKRSIEIIEIVRRFGPISRPDISKEMGINVVTISNYIDDFIKNNLVYEKSLDVSEGGRRPTLLDVNPRAAYTIGVGLNLMNMVGILMDVRGDIVIKTQIARPQPTVKDITECTLEIIRELLRRSKEYVPDIRGVGVGIAGLVNKKTGSVHWPQKVDQHYTYASVDLPLRELLEKEFSLPVLLENDATAACFGERWLDLARGYRNVIYMFSGVGCGIMINGEVYTGTHGYAGEVAIHSFRENDLLHCSAGNDCFLKRWETDLGIVQAVKNRLRQDKAAAAQFVKAASADADTVDLKGIFVAARAQDPLAHSVLSEAAHRLGIKIAYLVNLLNPQVVVIGGGLEEAGEAFLNTVSATVKEWTFREASEDLKVAYSQLRENAAAVGAASLVMQNIFAKAG